MAQRDPPACETLEGMFLRGISECRYLQRNNNILNCGNVVRVTVASSNVFSDR